MMLKSSKLLPLLSQRAGLTWCRKHLFPTRVRCLQTGNPVPVSNSKHDSKPDQWTTPFKITDPEFDTEYLLNPRNRDAIRDNISNRKGVGDINRVVDLWKKMQMETNEEAKTELRYEFIKATAEIPNTSHPDSPIGDECDANLVELVGEAKVEEGKPALKIVLELGEQLGMLRTSNASITTGGTSYYFTDQLAQLEQALVKFTVDNLLKLGFELISVPDLLHPNVIESCGFKTSGNVAQVYQLDSSRHPPLCLAGTAEMSLAGFFLHEVLQGSDLPKKVAAVSRCYRAETSHEADLGIYRVHQFTKVEMFGVTSNETGQEGNELLQDFVNIEKQLFQQLQLHFRLLDMPTAELGAPAHRKFDIEAWMPGNRIWGEVASASNCTDYQSRRLGLKYHTEADHLRHCTTVNGTACAVPRMIMALCETHQNTDGSISLPEALHKYMNGETVIKPLQKPTNMTWMKSNKLL